MKIFDRHSPANPPESPNLTNAASLAGFKLKPYEITALELYCATFKAGWDDPYNRAASWMALILLPERIRNVLCPGKPEKMDQVNKAVADLRALIGIPEDVPPGRILLQCPGCQSVTKNLRNTMQLSPGSIHIACKHPWHDKENYYDSFGREQNDPVRL